MSRVCSICGKGKMSGHKVSHSNRKTNRTWSPNVQKIKVEIDGHEASRYVCAQCIKTANKNQNA